MTVFKIPIQNTQIEDKPNFLNERKTNAIRNKIMFLQYNIFANKDCLLDTSDGMANNRKLEMKCYIPFHEQSTNLQDISQ
jgi:hypothetical protein